MRLFVGAVVTWLGYANFVYGLSQVRGCDYGWKDLSVPGRFVERPCHSGSGTTGETGGGAQEGGGMTGAKTTGGKTRPRHPAHPGR